MSMFMQSFNKVAIIIDYVVNKDFIANTLCENKEKPELKCHGKCQMSKRLVAEERKTKAPVNTNLADKFEIQLYYEEITNSMIFFVLDSEYTQTHQTSHYTPPVIPIFHPPAA